MLKKLTYVINEQHNVHFTSDTHFSHKNIIRYSNRPFPDQNTMDWKMIEKWNECVKPTDTIFILGDVCFGSVDDIISLMKRLNGTKHLCLGNHDREIIKNLNQCKEVFASISRDREINVRFNGTDYAVTLNHYTQLVWNKSHHGALHFWGHAHGGVAAHTQGADVGADCFDYAPVSFSQLLEYMSKQQKYPDCFYPMLKNDHHSSGD